MSKLFYNLIEKIYLSMPNNLVYYDSMTGIYSRNYYERVLKEKYLSEEVVVLYFDVNDLKKCNDSQGHYEGNLKIKRVVTYIMSLENIKDVCRLHGDEFCGFMNKEDFNKSNFKEHPEVSIGCVIKESYEDVSSAVRRADKRMYEEKGKE